MCETCEELIASGNLGLTGVANLLSGKCPYEHEPVEKVVIIKHPHLKRWGIPYKQLR